MLTIDRIRAFFPYLEDCTYLNTATAGLSWQGQGEAAAEFYDADKARGICGGGQWRAKADATRAELASLLSVASGAVHFVGSTTEALNLLALSMPLESGDCVVMADDEFPSVALSWEGLQSRGVKVTRVSISDEAERSEALAAAVGPRTRVLATSHVHWRSGTRVDLARLGAACREYDCRLIVDGAHAVGAVPIDASLTDAYCSSVFKWLLSGFGLGFVSLSERLAAELAPAVRGYGNEPPSRSLGYGHINYPGIYGLQATLRFLTKIGWEYIHARVQSLASELAQALGRAGFEVLTPEGARAGIVSFRHPQSQALVHRLAEQAIHVENGGAVVRVSPHFYNTEAELTRFMAAVKRLA
jgi:cysteine desulfurase/selenocysteine lyase